MGFPEFGTVRLSELASIKGKLGVGIERDRHFKAYKPISAYIEARAHQRLSFSPPGHLPAGRAIRPDPFSRQPQPDL